MRGDSGGGGLRQWGGREKKELGENGGDPLLPTYPGKWLRLGDFKTPVSHAPLPTSRIPGRYIGP
jgi:hypothetical protein